MPHIALCVHINFHISAADDFSVGRRCLILISDLFLVLALASLVLVNTIRRDSLFFSKRRDEEMQQQHTIGLRSLENWQDLLNAECRLTSKPGRETCLQASCRSPDECQSERSRTPVIPANWLADLPIGCVSALINYVHQDGPLFIEGPLRIALFIALNRYY